MSVELIRTGLNRKGETVELFHCFSIIGIRRRRFENGARIVISVEVKGRKTAIMDTFDFDKRETAARRFAKMIGV